jgi:hypothetical protein
MHIQQAKVTRLQAHSHQNKYLLMRFLIYNFLNHKLKQNLLSEFICLAEAVNRKE